MKPSQVLRNQKVGIADSGMAMAEITVARQSRRKKNTTTTARIAPSTIAEIELSYCCLVYSTEVNRVVTRTPGFSFSIFAISFVASSNTETSEAPRARAIEKVTTGLPPFLEIALTSL